MDVRLLEALVNAVLDHGSWCDAAKADFLSAIRREEARLAGETRQERDIDAERQWLEELFDRAQLSPQESRAISLAAEGWQPWEIAREMTPVRNRRRGWPLRMATVDVYLWRARQKLQPHLSM